MAAPLVSPEVIVGHKNRLLLLVSAPLVYRDAQGELSPIVELDIDGEIEAIRETIEFYGDRAGFDLEVGYATVSKVALALTSKTPPTIFHFVGHGARKEAETCLILEDATGLAREFPLSELRAILTATDAPPCLLAVLNACHSGAIAECFLESGTQYAIAVNADDKILDIASQCFAKHFYQCLLRGHKVGKAFDHAQRAVMVNDQLRTTLDGSTHEPVGANEAVKLKLLPPDGSRQIVLESGVAFRSFEGKARETSLP